MKLEDRAILLALTSNCGLPDVVQELTSICRMNAENLEAAIESTCDQEMKKMYASQAKRFHLYANGAYGLERCLRYIKDILGANVSSQKVNN
jgi:hypothetical protein